MTNYPKSLDHGSLTQVASGVHCVRGSFGMGPGMTIGRTMTVVDTGDGLALFNAVRLSESGLAELDALGVVKHLVKLSDSHGIDDPFYADRYQPAFWSLPGAKLDKLEADRSLGEEGPIKEGVTVDYGDTAGWREGAYWVPMGGGTLVTCDAIQNCADTEGANFLGRILTSAMGFKGGVVVPPMWRRFQKISGARVREALSGLMDLKFENLVTGHGPPIVGGAAALVRSAIERVSA